MEKKIEFAMICFCKVFALTYSGPTATLKEFFVGCDAISDSESIIKSLVQGTTARHSHYIDSINISDNQVNKILPQTILNVYCNVFGTTPAEGNTEKEQLHALLKIAMQQGQEIQSRVFSEKDSPAFKKYIAELKFPSDYSHTRLASKSSSKITSSTKRDKPSDDYENAKELSSEIVSTYTLEQSHKIRKKMIQQTGDWIYITGTTLKEAFSFAHERHEESIIDELFARKKEENKNEHQKFSNINIFFLNYLYMGTDHETADREIERSILNIMSKAEECLAVHNDCPKINIVLLSDFDIAFSLLTSEKLLTRSTHLFTASREYRGQYLLFDKDTLEYNSLKAYLDYLLDSSYMIDWESKKKSPYRIKEKLRRSVRLRSYIKLKKIHPVQLENLVRSSFLKKTTKNLTSMRNFLSADNTQQILIPYLHETEELLEKAIHKHDKSGWAKIIPACDLGFPNNVTRIAGGFLTGALYDWSCSVPFIPIDATVNTCTSSVFKLQSWNKNIASDDFYHIIETLCKNAMTQGYAFSFDSGNHFITLACDDEDDYYLVMHSSAKQSKESCFGLYPTERAWFRENIKTIYDNDDNPTRYLRYIRGDAAVRFYDYATRFREFNEEIHRYVAEEFVRLCGIQLSHKKPIIKHHYGMPTSSSIAIGTFVINVDEDNSHNRTVPIFSDYGKDLCLYRVNQEQKQTYVLAGTKSHVILVPHGWGQVIDDIACLNIRYVSDEFKRQLHLTFSDSSILKFDVTSDQRLNLKQKHIRTYTDIQEFLEKNSRFFNGSTQTLLHPVFCYCAKTAKP